MTEDSYILPRLFAFGKVCSIWWQPHSACCGRLQACWPSLALLFCALFTTPIIPTGELLVLLLQLVSLLLLLPLLLLPAGHPGHARGARLGGEDGTPRTSRRPSSSPLSLHPPRFGHETCCHTGWGRGPRPRVYHENQLVGRPQQHQVMSPRPLSTGGQWHEHLAGTRQEGKTQESWGCCRLTFKLEYSLLRLYSCTEWRWCFSCCNI